ncbi:MAG: HAD family hydrolase [Dehalococcoidia bacterium]
MLRAALFDLDGTLVDSAGLIARCLAETLRGFGYDVAATRVAAGLGPSTPRVVEALTGAAPGDVETMVETFGRLYASRRASIAKHPGADALLDALDEAGVGLALITNNPEVDVRALLDQLGWGARFAVVLGADSGAGRKPSAEPALRALALLDAGPEEAAFVGDTATDMLCASDAGIALRVLVGASGGGHGAVPPELPTHVVADLFEARALLEGIVAGASAGGAARGRTA